MFLKRKTQSCSLAPWDTEVCHVSVIPWFSARTVSFMHGFLAQAHCSSTATKVFFLASAEINLYKCDCLKQIWTASLFSFFFFCKWCIFFAEEKPWAEKSGIVQRWEMPSLPAGATSRRKHTQLFSHGPNLLLCAEINHDSTLLLQTCALEQLTHTEAIIYTPAHT